MYDERVVAEQRRKSTHNTLPDHIRRGCRVLFVGVNPGLRSAETGHHFAGHSNRFWHLMSQSGFLPDGFSCEKDADLPKYGWGITNLVSRPTSGVSDLTREDYDIGRGALSTKIRKFRPGMVALVGVMVYREYFNYREALSCGRQRRKIEGRPCYLLPNPSGRNAHFTLAEMLEFFRDLRRLV